ncbi:hypothetical protein [Streptomyces sp. NPDC097619]|uniref:hypothetical protein n=1 Tax=Streptomyces sp. NPDC097619 TaxID=3157228 RepID=UPI00332B1F60
MTTLLPAAAPVPSPAAPPTGVPERGALLTALTSLPTVPGSPLVSAPTAASATAATARVVADWVPVAPPAGTAPAAAVPQARLLEIAGTVHLQLRGLLRLPPGGRHRIGLLPPALRPARTVRGVRPGDTAEGRSACHVEVDARGRLWAAAPAGGPGGARLVTVRLDGFSVVRG